MHAYELANLNQALDLLDAIIIAGDGVTLSELSRTIGLSKNKIFRILVTFEQRGIVEKDSFCNYRLGVTAFGMAHRILSSESILDHARPVMHELAETLNEAVYLATMVGGEAIFQEMVDCHQPVRTTSFIGHRFPFTDPAVAGSGLAGAKASCSWLDVTKLNEEITTVSAALINGNGTIAGALVVLAPTFRMSMERIRTEITLPLREAAHQLSWKLGLPGGGATAAQLQTKKCPAPVTVGMGPISNRQGAEFSPGAVITKGGWHGSKTV